MVGQTCLECGYGPNGTNSCGLPDHMDDRSKDSPSPCGQPLESAPQYRHDYHATYSKGLRTNQNE